MAQGDCPFWVTEKKMSQLILYFTQFYYLRDANFTNLMVTIVLAVTAVVAFVLFRDISDSN